MTSGTPAASPDPGVQQAATPSAKLSFGKRLSFSLLAVGLGLILIEGALALLGVSPERFESDPYVGFSSSSPLFTQADGAEKGTFLTARNKQEFFNVQRFAATKHPGTFRIFCLGGSTTYGHPYNDPTSFPGWLREYLKATVPTRDWDVVNAGGISYASYREARLMEELVKYQPDLFVVYGSHNEFLEQRLYTRVSNTGPKPGLLTELARRSRFGTVVKQVSARFRGKGIDAAVPSQKLASEPDTELEKTLGPTSYKRDERQRAQIFQHYRFNLNRMADIAQSAGARILFITPASNLKDASPFKSEHREGLGETDTQRWQELYNQARTELGSPTPAHGLELLDKAAAIDDRAAHLHFLKGRLLEKLGRFQEAKEAYLRAKEEDVCPLRAPAEVRQILTEVSADRHVSLIDFEKIIEARAQDGIPGATLFLDHVHPTLEGYRILALEVLKRMEKDGLVRPNWDSGLIDRVSAEVLGRVDAKVHGFALMNVCKTLGWAGKREEAYRAGRQAARLAPALPDVHFEAGLAAFLVGQTNEAVGSYRSAIELRPNHASAHCNLAGLLEGSGDLDQALEHYKLALQHGTPKDAARDQRNLESALRKRTEKSGGN